MRFCSNNTSRLCEKRTHLTTEGSGGGKKNVVQMGKHLVLVLINMFSLSVTPQL